MLIIYTIVGITTSIKKLTESMFQTNDNGEML